MAQVHEIRRFKDELLAQMQRAANQDRPHVEINAGELHRAVFPGAPTDRILMACDVMREYLAGGDEVIFESSKSSLASLTVRYALPRPGAGDITRSFGDSSPSSR